MREAFSAFGSEIYRPLVTLVLPGAIGAFPWFIALMDRSSTVRTFVGGKPPEATLGFLLVLLFLGHVFEDLGSLIESRIFDVTCNRRSSGQYKENWYRYLRVAYRLEPVGHRYLRTLVLRMKFELNSVPALVVAIPGCWFSNITVVPKCIVTGVLLVLSLYLMWEACQSHKLLDEVRGQLLRGIIEMPSPASGDAGGAAA